MLTHLIAAHLAEALEVPQRAGDHAGDARHRLQEDDAAEQLVLSDWAKRIAGEHIKARAHHRDAEERELVGRVGRHQVRLLHLLDLRGGVS
jgi:hypothetical protein